MSIRSQPEFYRLKFYLRPHLTMTLSPKRRSLLLAAGALPLLSACATVRSGDERATERLAAIERSAGGRLGVAAIDLARGEQIVHRGDERFPLCSTFKVMAIAAILARSTTQAGLLDQRIHYTQADMVSYSPISEKHLDDGMTVAELCAAAMRYSDNSAVNLLMKILGGPHAVTAYARSIGDTTFQLERWETSLNTAIPGDVRDTSTPLAMLRSLGKLALGDGLAAAQQTRLQDWMLGNTTGDARIRAAVPKTWRVGDKTGSGDYGTANDVAILWPPGRPPIVLAVYYTREVAGADWRNDVIAAAAAVVVERFA